MKHTSGYPLPRCFSRFMQVVVFTGLLRLLGSNDDELAAVLAHEVGHVLARHPVRGVACSASTPAARPSLHDK